VIDSSLLASIAFCCLENGFFQSLANSTKSRLQVTKLVRCLLDSCLPNNNMGRAPFCPLNCVSLGLALYDTSLLSAMQKEAEFYER